MVFPKFVIEDDCLILSKVSYHRELISDESKVKGGGWYRYNNENKCFIFSGESHDFGKASFEDIKECIINNKVFTNKYQTHDISTDFDFYYDIGSEIINLK